MPMVINKRGVSFSCSSSTQIYSTWLTNDDENKRLDLGWMYWSTIEIFHSNKQDRLMTRSLTSSYIQVLLHCVFIMFNVSALDKHSEPQAGVIKPVAGLLTTAWFYSSYFEGFLPQGGVWIVRWDKFWDDWEKRFKIQASSCHKKFVSAAGNIWAVFSIPLCSSIKLIL